LIRNTGYRKVCEIFGDGLSLAKKQLDFWDTSEANLAYLFM